MQTIIKMLMGTSLVAAILPLMCCFGPALLSLMAGLGFVSGSLEWLHPAQPYFNALSATTLGVAHYKNFKGSKKTCAGKSCQNSGVKLNVNSWFLWSITLLVLALMITNFWYEF